MFCRLSICRSVNLSLCQSVKLLNEKVTFDNSNGQQPPSFRSRFAARSKNFAFRNKSCLESGSGCIPIRQVIGCNVKVIAAACRRCCIETKKKQNLLLRNRNHVRRPVLVAKAAGGCRSVAPPSLPWHRLLRLLRRCGPARLLIRTKVSQGLYVCGIHTHTASRAESSERSAALRKHCGA